MATTKQDLAKYVMDYAVSKQLRAGWGRISECYSLGELAQQITEMGCKTKAEALNWARGVVKYSHAVERDIQGA